MMVGHIDGETYHRVVELPLKESYTKPVYGLALIHWVIGVPKQRNGICRILNGVIRIPS